LKGKILEGRERKGNGEEGSRKTLPKKDEMWALGEG